jgi:hypothetical protein
VGCYEVGIVVTPSVAIYLDENPVPGEGPGVRSLASLCHWALFDEVTRELGRQYAVSWLAIARSFANQVGNS